MLEIFGLVFLIKEIRKMTEAKGVAAKKYIIITVVAWFVLEVSGAVVGLALWGDSGFEYIGLAILGAIVGGGIGYFITQNAMEKLPDVIPGGIEE